MSLVVIDFSEEYWKRYQNSWKKFNC